MPSPQAVTIVICVLVALGTLAGLWGGLSRTVRILRALKPGLDLARSLASHPVPEAAFAHRWADLDDAFRRSNIVAPVWTPFSASVERSTREDGSGAVASSTAPEDWFQARYLAAGPWTDTAVARLSGLMVSLGILGTFLGLTLGLVEADFGGIQALSSAEARTEALQAAMFGLLAGSSTAFLTSVAGLLGSLILTAVVRLGATRPVDRALGQVAAALRVGIRVEPPELRLAQQLERMADRPESDEPMVPVLERLIRVLEAERRPADRGPDEVVLEEVRDALRALAAPASEPAWATALVDRVAEPPPPVQLPDDLRGLLEAQQARLGEVVDAFAVQDRRWVALDARVRAVTDAVAEASARPHPVLEVPAALTDVLGRLEATLDGPNHPTPPGSTAAAEAVDAALAPTLARLTAAAGQFDSAAERFDRATSRLDAAARSNHDAADTLRQATESLSTRLAVLQQATAALRTGLAHHTDASNALTSAAASLQSVGPQLSRAADQVKLSASSMEVTADRLSALQRASGGPELARLVPVLESLLTTLERRR